MGLKVITPATLEPVTVAECKLQCHVDSGDTTWDTHFPLLIAAARQKAENYMGAAIMARELEQTLDEFPEADIRLERPPAWTPDVPQACPLAITSVKYIDEAGVEQTVAGTNYTLDTSVWPFFLLPAVDVDWPSPRAQANAVAVRYTVGYDAAAKVPGDLRAWLLMTVAFLFAQRETMVLDGKIAEIPSRYVDAMLDPYRVFLV